MSLPLLGVGYLDLLQLFVYHSVILVHFLDGIAEVVVVRGQLLELLRLILVLFPSVTHVVIDHPL